MELKTQLWTYAYIKEAPPLSRRGSILFLSTEYTWGLGVDFSGISAFLPITSAIMLRAALVKSALEPLLPAYMDQSFSMGSSYEAEPGKFLR